MSTSSPPTTTTTSAPSVPVLNVGDCVVDEGTYDTPELVRVPCESTVRGKLVLLGRAPGPHPYFRELDPCDDIPGTTRAYVITRGGYGGREQTWCMGSR